MTTRQETAAPGNTRRKTMAILAGGLVLGVGAAVTLAAWNDSEFATGTFTAGSFNLEGSTNGTDFTDHPSENDAAQLTFTAPVETLSPGDDVYAPFALRLTGTDDATLTAQDPVGNGSIAGHLTFEAVTTDVFGCDSDSFAEGDDVPNTIAADETVNLCLKVTADEELEQETTGDVLWQWDAESVN